MCQQDFKMRDVAVDHIHSVVNLSTGFTTWDDFINRLFCEPEAMQALCHACHDSKSDIEDKTRAAFNAQRKIEEHKIIKAAKRAAKEEAKFKKD